MIRREERKVDMTEVERIEVERIISFLEDDKSYFFKMAENPKYSDADRRKADDLFLDVKEAIKIIRKLESKENEVCVWTLKCISSVFNEKLYSTCTDRLNVKSDEHKYCPYCGRKIKVVE